MAQSRPGDHRIYLVSIVLLMAVLPILSIVMEVRTPTPDVMLVVGKWFVFWAAGVRLFTAGLRQTLQPAFTAEVIFEIKDAGAKDIVREVGFGNISIGLAAILSLWLPNWVAPCALIAGAYYGLAGLLHIRRQGRNAIEQIALVSDLAMFLILAGFLASRVS